MKKPLSYLIFVSQFIFFSCATTDVELATETEKSYELMDQFSSEGIKNYWSNELANNFIQHDVDVFRVAYAIADSNGDEVNLSGAILVPKIAEPKGIISIQHATFFGDEEAPSANGSFSVVSRKSIFASFGYVVLLPDYLGYGVDKDRVHPYHYSESLADATYGMIKYAQAMLPEILGEEISDMPIYLAGYSEGAYATAATMQRIELIGDIEIAGISMGSGAYNLLETFSSFLDTEARAYSCVPCNALFIQSYVAQYNLDPDMSTYFNAPYDDLIQNGLLMGEYTGTEVNQMLSVDPDEIYNEDFINSVRNGNAKWLEILQDNSIQDWDINVPCLLTHNETDNVSPPFNSADLASRNAENALVTYIPVSDTNHFDGIFAWGIYTMNYFEQL